MPELAEVEAYRRLAERVVGRRVAEVVAPDGWYLKRGLTARGARAALEGRTLTGVRRIGKVLLVETSADGPVLGLRFGMSGRLLVDGVAGVDDLLYASNRELEKWDRFALRFAEGGDMRMRDPRRLGGVELDPEEARLGPDALRATPADLARALGRSQAPLKARLMDQSRLAGVGNLAVDEALWRAGLDPARPAASLAPAELRRLHRHLRSTLEDFVVRGGSHTGDLMPERQPGGVCPRDGAPLQRRTVGGRTTWSCPRHQR
ncbi:MAG TPA: DNA-formamidopyrimidine glycosylase family protein [Acidimicrobiales bacterium]|nr:DNA-formamidopyrimidine glycosylase family protein [Acidimicrobiales bacterium]